MSTPVNDRVSSLGRRGHTRRQLLQGLVASVVPMAMAIRARAANRNVVYGDTTIPDGIRSRFVDNINGLRMQILEAGFNERDRPCVLLLHGFPELAYSPEGWRHPPALVFTTNWRPFLASGSTTSAFIRLGRPTTTFSLTAGPPRFLGAYYHYTSADWKQDNRSLLNR